MKFPDRGFQSLRARARRRLATICLAILGCAAPLAGQVSVWTWRYDNSRLGVDSNETQLTPARVASGAFGKLFAQPVDGEIYAQPLYLPNLSIPGQGAHNVVFVATENDSVYAFDADDNRGADAAPLWHDSFTDPPMGVRAVTSGDLGCRDIRPKTGITGTPVIDTSTGTLYFVTKTWENGQIVQGLHALDVATGAEKDGGPVVITAQVTGQAVDNDNGAVTFNPLMENQRPGLLLDHGVIYIAWGSTCDHSPWHGWLMAYDAATLRQLAVFNSTPDGNGGGFWQAGAAPSADDAGNVYIANANGTLDANFGGRDYASVILRMRSSGGTLAPADDFIPFNAAFLNASNEEPSSGVLLLPPQAGGGAPLALATSKLGSLYLLNRNQFGGFQATSDSQIEQEIPAASPGITSTPAWWNGFLYLIGGGEYSGPDVLKAYALSQGRLSAEPVMEGTQQFGFPGASPVVSANGTSGGIVWALRIDGWESGAPAVLYAWDAGSLQLLYSSDQNGGAGQAGPAVKFTVPVVANGKVYVGTSDELDVYGLQAGNFSFTVSPAWQAVDSGSAATVSVQSAASSSGSIGLQCSVAGTDCPVTPPVLAPGQTASASIAASALPTGTQTVSIEGSAGEVSHQQTATVKVEDFSLWLPGNQATLQDGASLQTSVQLTSSGGYDPSAQLACDQPPAGIHCHFDPAVVSSSAPSSTWTIAADPNAPGGVHAVTVQATHGGLQHAAVLTLSLVDYALQLSSATVTATPADTPVLQVTATGPAGSPESIQLGCAAAGAIQCSFQPSTIRPGQSSQLTLSHLAAASAGVVGLTVTGTVPTPAGAPAGTLVARTPLTLTIADFSLGASASSQTLTRGAQTASFTVTTEAENGMTQPVGLSCTVAAPATCALNPASVTPGQSSVLTIAGLGQVSAASLNVIVLGAAGSDLHQLPLTVNFADFQINASETRPTLQPGVHSLSLNVSAAPVNGFNGAVTLDCGRARGITCAFSPASVLPGQTSSAIITGVGAAPGSSVLVNIEGSSAGLVHALPVTILIGDFALSAQQDAGTVTAGGSAQFPFTLTSYNEFAGEVTLGCGGVPGGGSCYFTPAQVTLTGDGSGQATLNITTVARSAAPAAPATGTGGRAAPELLLAGLLCAGLLLAPWPRARWKPGLALAALLLLEAACGGGPAARGTPAGARTITVSAVSGTVRHILPFELTVK